MSLGPKLVPRRFGFAAVSAFVLGSLSACELPLMCTDELGMSFSPPSPTLAVGQSVNASLELSSCGGRERWHPSVTWRTDDSLVVAVGSSSGRVTGRAAGDALVLAVERDSVGNEHTYPYRVRVR
jgi:hypothetical protein